MRSALASAPTARSRRPACSSRPPARVAAPACSASPAASTHHPPGRPGWACSTAARPRPASIIRSGGSRPASTASWVSACRNRNPSPSTAMICSPTPRRSAARMVSSPSPVIGPSSDQSNWRPMTAPAQITCRVSGSTAARRRATASPNVGGTPADTWPAVCHWPSCSTSTPFPSMLASTSSTGNGTPSARSATKSWAGGGSVPVPRQASVMSVTAAGSSRPSGSTAAAPRVSSAAARLCASPVPAREPAGPPPGRAGIFLSRPPRPAAWCCPGPLGPP